MFYTGLSMFERGRVQRVGVARSDDLYAWHKDRSGKYPLEIPGIYYEHRIDEGRHWVSFRDPFIFDEGGQKYLLAAARVNHGPIIRRGCVALAEEVGRDQFEFHPPLFHPMQYDDLEVPNLVNLNNRYYLIGSIREDVKVHYWYADSLTGPYKNFSDNVLMPQGNYAARVSRAGDRYLVWNFFFKGLTTRGQHLMAPPKELVVDESGELRLKSFSGFERLAVESFSPSDTEAMRPLYKNPHAAVQIEAGTCWVRSSSGFEAFLLPGEHRNFILGGELHMVGSGKCGLVLRLNDQGDGYYLSLDLYKGIVQVRAWGSKAGGSVEESFHYQQLQAAHYVPKRDAHPFRLIAYE